MSYEEIWEEEEGFGSEPEEEGCAYGCGEFCENPQTRENGLCTTDCNTYLCSVEAAADGGTLKWQCKVCGCTDTNACPGGCHWVRKNLCSTCANKQKAQVQENMEKSLSKHVAFAAQAGDADSERGE